MYQYYISEKKDEVFDGLKNSKKITKENLPAATQLFTPRWIVEYMVENTLGRAWLEAHPNSELQSKWQYYIESTYQNPEVKEKLDLLIDKSIKPEELTFFDPAMGSGHILVYAFDIFFEIYKHLGYMEREIPKLILENNLYGLDIDDRAGQLAYFALMMKGRSRSASFFKQKIDPKIHAIQESFGISKDAMNFFADPKATKLENSIHVDQVKYLIDIFADGKVLGSLLEVDNIDYDSIENRIYEIENGIGLDLEGIQHRDEIMMLLPLVHQARVMSRKYDIVTTNPPYMGNSKLNEKLKSFFFQNYVDVKSDFFSVFIERNYSYTKQNGHLGFMSPFVWMFISSYEKLRENMINQKSITSLVQLEYSGFEEATVPICTFTLRNCKTGETGEYIKLSDFRGAENQPTKTLEAVKNPNVNYRFSTTTQKFALIPGAPIAYWISDNYYKCFERGIRFKTVGDTRQGMATSDVNRFTRLWFEVNINSIGFNYIDLKETENGNHKWFPYIKGGTYRKWYGNSDYVVNWHCNGYEVKAYAAKLYKSFSRTIKNISEYLKPCISWGMITSSDISVRYYPKGYIFDIAGCCCFSDDDIRLYLLGLMNTKITNSFTKVLNPTLNLNVGDIANLPLIIDEENKGLISGLVEKAIEISKEDWDSFETSWDFKIHPLLTRKFKSIKDSYEYYNKMTIENYNLLKAYESQINSIFNDIYQFSEEMNPDVDDNHITIRKAEIKRDIRNLISYSVGCMLGRYGIDNEGLVYAGGEWDHSKYSSYLPSRNNLIIITEEKYFDDDIVERFIQFIKVVYGDKTLEENLDFIASALGNAGDTSREVIRNYFVKDFYKDHAKTYKGKPVYWLLDSGKQNGFKALFYLHRYKKDDLAMIRTEYLHELQKRYESHLGLLKKDSNPSARTKKQIVDLEKKLDEIIAYDKVVAYLSHQQIELDLDDGVDINYEKFQGVEIPQGDGMKPLKANLLAKR